VLAHAIVKEGAKAVAAGMNPRFFLPGLQPRHRLFDSSCTSLGQSQRGLGTCRLSWTTRSTRTLAPAIMQPAEQCYTGFDQAFARNGLKDRQSQKGEKRKHRSPTSHAGKAYSTTAFLVTELKRH
jgi:hypothetical protein